MRTIAAILFAVLIIPNVSVVNIPGKDPGEVVITGTVLNFKPENSQIKLVINRLAFPPEDIEINLNQSGRFNYSYTVYIPSDVYIDCGNSFYMVVHPGDSINVEFDGQKKDFLRTIKFSGSAVNTNVAAAEFQRIYSPYSLYSDPDTYFRKIKESDPEEYLHFLDSCKVEWNKLYGNFVNHYKPDKETRNWIATFLEKEFYYNYSWYPVVHRQLNNLKKTQWDVPDDYYDRLKGTGPVTKSMTISTDAMNSLINSYRFFYALNKTIDENKLFMGDTTKTELEKSIFIINGLVKYTSDPLLRQMVITEMLVEKLNHSEVDLFEKEKKLIEEYVKEPYLKEPLYQLYDKVNEELKNPEFASDAVIKETEDSSIKQIIDSITTDNRGKVIYLDCWATWCGPCLQEMPNSKSLMKELKGKDVTFVYLCVDSEEKIWKSVLTKLQLGGQQYYLDKQQSTDLRQAYGIVGIPFYILMDKDGNIVEKGTDLRPGVVKEKIMRLL